MSVEKYVCFITAEDYDSLSEKEMPKFPWCSAVQPIIDFFTLTVEQKSYDTY